MFSGIVGFQSRIVKRSKEAGMLNVEIRRPKGLAVQTSESVAVNGICSTVVGVRNDVLTLAYMPETVRQTNIGALKAGDLVNLEAPLVFGGRVNGHFVTGHIDTTGTVLAIAADGGAKQFSIGIPVNDMRYILPKGSIAVEGVGLTIVGKDHGSFTASTTPYTLTHTNLGAKRKGDKVNIEYDSIAKYLNEIIRPRPPKPRRRREAKSVRVPGRHRAKPL